MSSSFLLCCKQTSNSIPYLSNNSKTAVANKIIKPETSYIEDLYNLNKKKKLEESKKKRKPTIGFATPSNVKKAKVEDEDNSIVKDEIDNVKSGL